MVIRCFLALVLTAFALTACENTTGAEERILSGAEVAMGQGTAHTEVTVDPAGDPTRLAIVFTETALNGLLDTPAEFVLPLPQEATATPFDHGTINWMPMGHPPPGIYSVPHLDIHFYMISQEERNSIVPTDPEFAAKAVRDPGSGFTPPDYVGDPFAIPRMGAHWTDRTAPEWNGQPFTRSFLYGYYDGELIFLEPMATIAFLQTRPNVTEDLKIPSQYPRAGHYPTRWAVRFDADRGEYRVELTDLVERS